MIRKFKPKDMVRIVKMEKGLEEKYDIGDICEIKCIHGGEEYDYAVWTTDRRSFWFFNESELEGVEDD